MPAKAPQNSSAIPNQVFLGCPWHVTLPKYQKAIAKLKTQFPLRFSIVGQNDVLEADNLLEKIKARIDSSSCALFDVSRGNPNVSLEYGYAEARNTPRFIFLSTHRAARRHDGDAPIISDLAAKSRGEYKREQGLERLLKDFCERHPFAKRFELVFPRDHHQGERGKRRAVALALVHAFTEEDTTLFRSQIDHRLRGLEYRGTKVTRRELDGLITFAIKRLAKARLVRRRRQTGFALA